ncbi:MAG: hypothetical protein ACKPBF_04350, partial [Actinomycetota bacterium]
MTGVGVVVASSLMVAGPASSAATERPAASVACTRIGAVRKVGSQVQVCTKRARRNIWVTQKGTSSTASSTTTVPAVSGLPRSAVDRPGANTADIKFIYVTFKDGPDSRRDSNGDIAGMASEVNRYYQSQFPGKRLRFDTFEGGLDVQHMQLPLSNAEFNRRWCFNESDSPAGCDRPDVLNVLEEAFRNA